LEFFKSVFTVSYNPEAFALFRPLKFPTSHPTAKNPKILTESDPPSVDLSVADIRWQIAAEWLETAQWLQSLFENTFLRFFSKSKKRDFLRF